MVIEVPGNYCHRKMYLHIMKVAFVICLLILIGFSSCKTSFRISVQTPAIVKLPPEVRRLGVVNNITRDNSPEKVVVEIIESQSINGNVAAAENAPEGIFRGLDNSRFLSGMTVEPFELSGSTGVNWIYIDSLCDTLQLDGLIEMAEIKTISPIGGSVLASALGQSSTRLEGHLYTNVYFPNSHTTMERLHIRRYYNIPLSGGATIVDILNDVQRKQHYYRSLGYELGYGTGSLFVNKWVWVSRDYYTKGCETLKRARPMIKEGNWDIAEKQLLQDADFGKEKIRGRVLFNLALVKEGQGDLDAAIQYAERSALECGNKLANEYLVKLRKRKRQMSQL